MLYGDRYSGHGTSSGSGMGDTTVIDITKIVSNGDHYTLNQDISYSAGKSFGGAVQTSSKAIVNLCTGAVSQFWNHDSKIKELGFVQICISDIRVNTYRQIIDNTVYIFEKEVLIYKAKLTDKEIAKIVAHKLTNG